MYRGPLYQCPLNHIYTHAQVMTENTQVYHGTHMAKNTHASAMINNTQA